MGKFLLFGEALVVARSLNLASRFEWNEWCKEGRRPPNVPSNPQRTYKDGGWQGWVHWLGSSGIKKPSKFAPFGQALTFAQSLGLANKKEWKVWCKEGRRPPNVPSHPNATYKDGGWQGWGHWLGTGNQSSKTNEFLPFGETLVVARSLNLADRFEWREWCKEGMCPPNVPSNPDHTYKDGGWQGWGHWLGSGNIKKASKFAPFSQTLTFAQSLNLASAKEWRAWCKEGLRPPNVPSHPDLTYKDSGWQGWGHWLGSGNRYNKDECKRFLPFDEALAAAQSLGLASSTEWKVWCKAGTRPPNVPPHPNATYKDGGWQGWGHWLGTGNQSNKAKQAQFLPFDGALAVARSLNLANTFEWQQWCKEGMCPPNVPSHPHRTYKDGGWQGWVHWLGSGSIKKASKFAPFGTALTFAQSLGLGGTTEWKAWCKEGMRPPNVPSEPCQAYKDGGWQGWGHWLGTGKQSSKAKKAQFLPFDEALRVARSLRLVSKAEWQAWCRTGTRPANVPACPDQVYVHDGWWGWEHWLYHANPDAAAAQAVASPARKRTGGAGAAGKSRGKRQRR